MKKNTKKLFSGLLSLSLALMSMPGMAVNAEAEAEEPIQKMIDLTGSWNNHVSYHGAYYDHAQSATSDTAEADDKNVGYHKDYILVSGNDGNYTATNGIKDYTVKGVVDPDDTGNTVLTKNGIKFDLKKIVTTNPGQTGDPDSIRVKGSGKTIPVNGVFGKIHFAASARSVINSPVEQAVYNNGIKDYEVTVNYADGTKDTQYVDILGAGYGNQFMEVDSSKLTDTVKYAFKVKDGKSLPENFLLWSKGCVVYQNTSTTVGTDFSLWYYTVDANPSKTVESITFKAKEGTYDADISNENANDLLPSNEILLFAITGESPVLYEDKTEATVVYFGGSIPELGAGEMFKEDGTVTTVESEAASKGWCKMITDYLRAEYTGTKFTEVNAGWGGTGTSYGFLRLYDDVIKYNPDIVFISCAVNDLSQYGGAWGIRGETQAKQNLEAIIRRLSNLENPPKICMVYSSAADLSDSQDTAIAWHEEVADYYGVDGINIHAYLKTLDPAAEENSEMFPNDTFADLFRVNDNLHPNFRGHKVYGNYVISQLSSGAASLNAPLKKDAAFSGDRMDVYNAERKYLIKTGVEGLTLSDDWNEGTYSAYDTGIHDANRVYITNLQSDGTFAESTLEYEFTGGIFGIKGVQFANGTTFNVEIDGKTYGTLTSKSSGNGSPFDWVTTGLSKGTHRAKITAPTSGAIYLEHFYTDPDSKAADLDTLYKPLANQECISLSNVFNNHVTHYAVYWSEGEPYGGYGDGGDGEVGISGQAEFIYKGESSTDAYSLRSYVDPEGTGNKTIVKDGIKFDFSKLFNDNTGLGGAKHSVRIKGEGMTIPVSGNYENIHFAAVARSVKPSSAPENKLLEGSLNDYNVTVKYTDGTENTQKFDIYGARYVNKFIHNVATDGTKNYQVKDGAVLPGNLLAWGKSSMVYTPQSDHDRIFGIHYYSVDLDSSKTVESITFKPEEGTTDTLTDNSAEDLLPSGELLLFAMTGEKEENLPQTMFDIGKYCNSLAVAKAGVANNTPHGDWDHVNGVYLADLVDLEGKILDENYQVEKDGVKYDMSQVKHPYARAIYVGKRTTSANTKTISGINEYFSKINFIAGRDEDVKNLPVKVTYKDGTVTEKVFEIGPREPATPLAGNEITSDKCPTGNIGARILNFSPDQDAVAYTLYAYSLDVDPTKEISSITFGTTDETLLATTSAHIFAVTGVNANGFELSDAVLLTKDYKNVENPVMYAGKKVNIDFRVKSDTARSGKLIVAVYDGNTLVGVDSVDLTVTVGISDVSKEITIPENINSNCDISCMVWENVDGMKPLFIKNMVK